MKYYVVDAFTREPFGGNPAGVCLLDSWIDAKTMQSIAFENNLAETAFLVKEENAYGLRWFAPECEIDLCGHATLASAFVLMQILEPERTRVDFSTKSGRLTVKKEGDLLLMDFPSNPPEAVPAPEGLPAALGAAVLETYRSRDLLAVVENEETVKNLTPDFELLKRYKEYLGIIVTAKGQNCDFVSRFFAPNTGVAEDPVTGSSHTMLIPFWSERLGRAQMTARQLSKRGGSLSCRLCGSRVEIGGNAVLYLAGEIKL